MVREILADALFEGEDLNEFIGWHAHINPSVGALLVEDPLWIPDLPTAAEYAAFRRWKRVGEDTESDDDEGEDETMCDDVENSAWDDKNGNDKEEGDGGNEKTGKEEDVEMGPVKDSAFVLAWKCGHRLHPSHPAVRALLGLRSSRETSRLPSVDENHVDENSDEEADVPASFVYVGEKPDSNAQAGFLASLGSGVVARLELARLPRALSNLFLEDLTHDQEAQQKSSKGINMQVTEKPNPPAQDADGPAGQKADDATIPPVEEDSNQPIGVSPSQPMSNLGSVKLGDYSPFSAPIPYPPDHTHRIIPSNLRITHNEPDVDSSNCSHSRSSSPYSVLSVLTTVHAEYCPVCSIRQHLDLLTAIQQKWIEKGGPWRRRSGTLYYRCEHAWHRAKVALLNAGIAMERWAEAEDLYDQEHAPEIEQMIDGEEEEVWEEVKTHGAKEAIRIMKGELLYPVPVVASEGEEEDSSDREEGEVKDEIGWSHYYASDKYQRRSRWTGKPKKQRAKLRFTDDTEENEQRMNMSFNRFGSHPWYAPDRHACPDPDGWEDTSFLRSWQYVVGQCRILLVQPSGTLESPGRLQYKHLNSGPDRGDNFAVRRLIGMIERWFDEQEDEALRNYWLENLRKTTVSFRVWEEGLNLFEEEDFFDHFGLLEDFEGSDLEWWARRIGDLEPDTAADAAAQHPGGELSGLGGEPPDLDFIDGLIPASPPQEDILDEDIQVDEVEQAEELDEAEDLALSQGSDESAVSIENGEHQEISKTTQVEDGANLISDVAAKALKGSWDLDHQGEELRKRRVMDWLRETEKTKRTRMANENMYIWMQHAKEDETKK
ncbi:hypothetical protein P154DRAFT_523199 [Amniculicola lignicola CBS 123094]|uniref:Uncharacterized protein n=1 Tax=Amniculicola lignicola CBS 123094 TaxID=1392246 RepID=A0A6A5WCQ3_9PLEO|nr:hypothetical protein P154DRAFT_523199 [Amniculicola lignicola CBS 123094]